MPVVQRIAVAITVCSVVALLGPRVEAQEIQLTGPLTSALAIGRSSEPASKSSNSLILPTGHLELGGGRQKVDDIVDPAVGFVITARPGDTLRAGEPIASIHARTDDAAARAAAALALAIEIGDAATPLPLVSHRVTASGVERL